MAVRSGLWLVWEPQFVICCSPVGEWLTLDSFCGSGRGCCLAEVLNRLSMLEPS